MVWNFLWNNNSPWAWVIDFVLAFLIVKFIFYPGLAFMLGTTHPIVAVVSESMEHNGDFDKWWSSYADCGFLCKQSDFYAMFNISKDDFLSFGFKNGFNKGDLIVLRGKKPEDIKVGDVIVFQANQPDPIIHRVIKKWYDNTTGEYFFMTKGDHNPMVLRHVETNISEDKIVGVGYFRIPLLGYIKIWFVKLLIKLGLVRSL